MRYIHIDRSLPMSLATYKFYDGVGVMTRIEFELGEFKKAFLLGRPTARRGIVFPVTFVDLDGNRPLVYSRGFVGHRDDWFFSRRRLTGTA